jgi:amino acid permease
MPLSHFPFKSANGQKATAIACILLLLWRGHIHLLQSSFLPTTPLSHSLLPFGAALVAVLWAYEGWHVVSFTAGEFQSPKRDPPQSRSTKIETKIQRKISASFVSSENVLNCAHWRFILRSGSFPFFLSNG